MEDPPKYQVYGPEQIAFEKYLQRHHVKENISRVLKMISGKKSESTNLVRLFAENILPKSKEQLLEDENLKKENEMLGIELEKMRRVEKRVTMTKKYSGKMKDKIPKPKKLKLEEISYDMSGWIVLPKIKSFVMDYSFREIVFSSEEEKKLNFRATLQEPEDIFVLADKLEYALEKGGRLLVYFSDYVTIEGIVLLHLDGQKIKSVEKGVLQLVEEENNPQQEVLVPKKDKNKE